MSSAFTSEKLCSLFFFLHAWKSTQGATSPPGSQKSTLHRVWGKAQRGRRPCRPPPSPCPPTGCRAGRGEGRPNRKRWESPPPCVQQGRAGPRRSLPPLHRPEVLEQYGGDGQMPFAGLAHGRSSWMSSWDVCSLGGPEQVLEPPQQSPHPQSGNNNTCPASLTGLVWGQLRSPST